MIAIESVSECAAQCQRPVSLFKALMQQNLRMLQSRQKTCLEACPGWKQKNNEFFGCAAICIEEDIKVVRTLDKRLTDECMLNMDAIF